MNKLPVTNKTPDPEPQTCAVPGPIPPHAWAAARDAAIDDFLGRFATDCPDRDVLADMMVTITRLARDGTGRGELKLLTKAFKELRYAFKVFAPYTTVRKVSMFGSSRTPMDHPDYIQADGSPAACARRTGWSSPGRATGSCGPGNAGPAATAASASPSACPSSRRPTRHRRRRQAHQLQVLLHPQADVPQGGLGDRPVPRAASAPRTRASRP